MYNIKSMGNNLAMVSATQSDSGSDLFKQKTGHTAPSRAEAEREREHKCPLTDENYPTVFLLSFKQAKTTQLALCVCLLKTGYLLQEFTSGLK